MKSAPAWLLFLWFASSNCLAQKSDEEQKLVVQGIECRGNAITSCDYIRDRLYLARGAPVNEEEIGNAKLRLSSLARFSSVDIRLEKGAEKGRVVVVIEVVETDPITVESAIGTSWRLSTLRESIAGRITNENLFGTEKVLSFEAAGAKWLTGAVGDGGSYRGKLLYADPRLFGSSKYFLIGSLRYSRNRFDYTDLPEQDKHLDAELFGIDLAVGRRIFDFSYINVGYQARPIANFYYRYLQDDGTYKVDTSTPHGILFADYGWNSEDDPYFPTRGSRLNFHDGYDAAERYHYFGFGFRKTWTTDTKSTWTWKVGAAPGSEFRSSLDEEGLLLGVAYARSISPRDSFGGILRGRWYVELGAGPAGEKSNGDNLWEAGVKAGVRLDTKSFGLIDLYLIGSHEINTGGSL